MIVRTITSSILPRVSAIILRIPSFHLSYSLHESVQRKYTRDLSLIKNYKESELSDSTSKGGIISRLNFLSQEDAKPFYDLDTKTLLEIFKTTKKDERCGYCKNRLYYLSSSLECPPSVLSKLLAKRTFIYALSFEWLDSSLNVLKEFKVSHDRILRDLWVLRYNHKTIEERLLRVKNAGIDHYYPWMVRCSENILKRYITLTQETRSILKDTKSTKNYLAHRLNTKPEFIDEIFLKIPTLRCIRVTKVKTFMDFLIQEGFDIEDIASKPRILAASQKTVTERLRKLQSLGLDNINLNVLCRSREDFKKFCDSLSDNPLIKK